MNSQTDCGNWWGFSQSSWWCQSAEYPVQSAVGRIWQERWHLGVYHTSTGIWDHGKIFQGITYKAWDLEKLAADLRREVENKTTDDLTNTPKNTVLSMIGLTSPLWTLGMFQMVTGESFQYIRHTKQTKPSEIGVRHAACTVSGYGHVIRYQNTSNLEQCYIRGGSDKKELTDRLTGMHHLERQESLGSTEDGSMTMSHIFNTPTFTSEKNLRYDISKSSFTIGLEVC